MVEYLPGRVVAATHDEALDRVVERIKKQGFLPGGNIRIYPARVQPLPGAIWFEFYAEVFRCGP